MAPRRMVCLFLGIAVLAGCAFGDWYQSYRNGRTAGCATARSDAMWPGYDPIPMSPAASDEFRQGYREAYDECFAYAIANPRATPAPGSGR